MGVYINMKKLVYSLLTISGIILLVLIVLICPYSIHLRLYAAGLILIAVLCTGFNNIQRKKHFDARKSLADAVIYHRFYAKSGISPFLVAELWHEIEEILELSPGKLRPTDRFGVEIGQKPITSDSNDMLDSLASVATRRAKKYFGSVNFENIKTADDYICHFATLAASSSVFSSSLDPNGLTARAVTGKKK